MLTMSVIEGQLGISRMSKRDIATMNLFLASGTISTLSMTWSQTMASQKRTAHLWTSTHKIW